MIGKEPSLLRATIQPTSYEKKDESEYVLLGDTQEFPGAYVEFKVKVSPPKEKNDKRMPMMNGSSTMDENALQRYFFNEIRDSTSKLI